MDSLAKIVALLASGQVVAEEVRTEANREKTYAEYEKAFFERRRAQGLRSVDDDEGVSRRDILPHLGEMRLTAIRPANIREMRLTAIRPANIREVLQSGVAKGLRKNTVRTIRAVMNRTLRAVWEEELITENPVARVRNLRMSEVRRARMILTDAEIAAYIGSPRARRVDLKIMSLAARTEGGMRTGDITRWDSYVMTTKRMQQIPAAALPELPEGLGTALPFGLPLVSPSSAKTANNSGELPERRGSDSNRRMTVLQTVA